MSEQKQEQSIFGNGNPTSNQVPPLTPEERNQRRLSWHFYFSALGILVAIIIVVVCSYILSRPKDNRSYTDERYAQITIKDESKILTVSDEPYYILFFSETCATCEIIKTTVLDYVESTEEHKTLYLADIDMSDYYDEELEDYKSVIGVNNLEDFKFIGYPTMLEIENATIIDVFIGTEISPELLA